MGHKRRYKKTCSCGSDFTVEHDDYEDVDSCESCRMSVRVTVPGSSWEQCISREQLNLLSTSRTMYIDKVSTFPMSQLAQLEPPFTLREKASHRVRFIVE